MKLYATLAKIENGQSEGVGSNERLDIRLKQGNKEVASIVFIEGYIEIWTKDNTGDHYWNREIVLKGKKQKGDPDDCISMLEIG